MQIKLAECNENTNYEDNVMHVQYIPLYPSDVEVEDLSNTNETDLNKNIQVGAASFNSTVSIYTL